MKKALEDKEKEVHQTKEVAVLEYHDSDALLLELGVLYNDGFDDALRQVKALCPELDVSSVNINLLGLFPYSLTISLFSLFLYCWASSAIGPFVKSGHQQNQTSSHCHSSTLITAIVDGDFRVPMKVCITI